MTHMLPEDWLEQYKRALEDGDRMQAMARDARHATRFCEDWDEWPHETQVHYLMNIGFSGPEACQVLEFIDWQDAKATEDSDP